MAPQRVISPSLILGHALENQIRKQQRMDTFSGNSQPEDGEKAHGEQQGAETSQSVAPDNHPDRGSPGAGSAAVPVEDGDNDDDKGENINFPSQANGETRRNSSGECYKPAPVCCSMYL